jgi:hypothetical protein
LNSLGILTAIPSILTGLSELYAIWQGQTEDKGLKGAAKGAKEERDLGGVKLKKAVMHASLMDLVVGASVLNW